MANRFIIFTNHMNPISQYIAFPRAILINYLATCVCQIYDKVKAIPYATTI